MMCDTASKQQRRARAGCREHSCANWGWVSSRVSRPLDAGGLFCSADKLRRRQQGRNPPRPPHLLLLLPVCLALLLEVLQHLTLLLTLNCTLRISLRLQSPAQPDQHRTSTGKASEKEGQYVTRAVQQLDASRQPHCMTAAAKLKLKHSVPRGWGMGRTTARVHRTARVRRTSHSPSPQGQQLAPAQLCVGLLRLLLGAVHCSLQRLCAGARRLGSRQTQLLQVGGPAVQHTATACHASVQSFQPCVLVLLAASVPYMVSDTRWMLLAVLADIQYSQQQQAQLRLCNRPAPEPTNLSCASRFSSAAFSCLQASLALRSSGPAAASHSTAWHTVKRVL